MNSTHEGKQILAELGITPVYTISLTDGSYLTDSEREYLLLHRADDDDCKNTLAFTSPTCDLMFKNGALRYDWEGRGFCCVFVEPPEFLGATATLGTMIHEAGHYLSFHDNPSRDDLDFSRAMQSTWQSMKSDAEYHDRQWLRATVHLWHRATAVLGYEIPFDETVRLEQYGFTRHDLAPLLDEASRHEGEDIESILRGHGVASDRGGIAQPQSTLGKAIERVGQQQRDLQELAEKCEQGY